MYVPWGFVVVRFLVQTCIISYLMTFECACFVCMPQILNSLFINTENLWKFLEMEKELLLLFSYRKNPNSKVVAIPNSFFLLIYFDSHA